MMYNFRLRSNVSRNSSVDPRDTLSTKRALSTLGHYRLQKNLEQYGITDFVDEGMFDGIRSFQRQKGLKEDGLMRKGGPTERMLDTSLSAVTRQRQKAIKQRLDKIRKPDTARPDQRRNSPTEQRRESAQSRETRPPHKIAPYVFSTFPTYPDPKTYPDPSKPRPAPRPDRGSDVFGIILDALGFPTLEDKRKQQEEQGGRHYPQPTTRPEGEPKTRFPEKVGRGGKNPNSKGTQLVKTALTMLGYAFDDKRQPDKDDDGTDLGFAIENLQRDFNLKRDGYLIPGGETATKIAELITPMAHQSREGSFSNWLASLVKGAHAKSPENNATKSVTKKTQSDEEEYVLPEDIILPPRVEYSEDDISSRYSPTQEMKDSIRRKDESSFEYKLRTQVKWDGVSDPKLRETIKRTMRHEGGFSDNPNDPGGPTNYGISQNFLNQLRTSPHHKKFHNLPENAKDIDPRHAAAIYAEYYPGQKRINLAGIRKTVGDSEIADNLFDQVYDSVVNSGESKGRGGTTYLQRALNRAEKNENLRRKEGEGRSESELDYDGYIGEKTINKLDRFIRDESGQIDPEKLKIINNIIVDIRLEENVGSFDAFPGLRTRFESYRIK